MRKKTGTRIYNKWEGYSVEDCDCEYCRYWLGEDIPCLLPKCVCETERNEAFAAGRIESKWK